MACDFFHPRLGGVEQHILSLSHHLIARGCKVCAYWSGSTLLGPSLFPTQVIVVTRGYDDRIGVRYFTNGIKVYYAPMKAMPVGVVVPVFLDFLPTFRSIVLREGVTIVHGHQVSSAYPFVQ